MAAVERIAIYVAPVGTSPDDLEPWRLVGTVDPDMLSISLPRCESTTATNVQVGDQALALVAVPVLRVAL